MGLGFRVWDLGVWGLELMGLGLGFRGLGFRVTGFGMVVSRFYWAVLANPTPRIRIPV